MLVEVLRWTMDVIVEFNFSFARDIDLPQIPSHQLAHSHSVMLDPPQESLLKGVIVESAKQIGGLAPLLRRNGSIGAPSAAPRHIPGV